MSRVSLRISGKIREFFSWNTRGRPEYVSEFQQGHSMSNHPEHDNLNFLEFFQIFTICRDH